MSCRQFTAILSGAEQVPPVTGTNGRGAIALTYKCGKLTVGGSFSGLSSPLLVVGESAGHIHQGAVGATGPVIFPLNIVADANNLGGTILRSNNVFSLTCAQKKALKAGNLYINIHTVAYPNGEIRGQILPL